jgi:hypothetical protein
MSAFFKARATKERVRLINGRMSVDVFTQVVRTIFFYNAHKKKKDARSGIVQPDMRGKLKMKSKISEEMKEFITDHIRSFPVIESHYCRASTSKQYLEGSLNITKMYNLYLERCRDDGKEPAKASFHKPKSDRCPVCEKERVAVKENIQIQESERRYYEKHEKYDSNTFVS